MYLLDTNIVIDFCNSKLPDEAIVLFMGIIPTIPFITQIELFASSKITVKEKMTLVAFCQMKSFLIQQLIPCCTKERSYS